MIDELARRNNKALSEGLKAERAKNLEMMEIVKALEQTVAQLQGELHKTQQTVNILFAGSKGNGATT